MEKSKLSITYKNLSNLEKQLLRSITEAMKETDSGSIMIPIPGDNNTSQSEMKASLSCLLHGALIYDDGNTYRYSRPLLGWRINFKDRTILINVNLDTKDQFVQKTEEII